MQPNQRLPRRHELKCHPEFFPAVYEGRKSFEVRIYDRDYTVGDILWLREYGPVYAAEPPRDLDGEVPPDAGKSIYTGRDCFRWIIYILQGGQFGVETGYVVLGLGPIPN